MRRLLLFALTSTVDFVGASASLWLALYLLGRGVSPRITWRAMAVLLCLSAFFLWGYITAYGTALQATAVRAIISVSALAIWNDLVLRTLPEALPSAANWRAGAFYIFGTLTILLLLGARPELLYQRTSPLLVMKMQSSVPLVIYAAFLILASLSILSTLWFAARSGSTRECWYFWLASVVVVLAIGYRLVAATSPVHLPRSIQDLLILCSVILLAYSIARSEVVTQQRALRRDLPISALTASGLAAIYLLIAWRLGSPPLGMAAVAGVAILTHSAYDLVRGHLDRLNASRPEESVIAAQAGDHDAGAAVELATVAPIASLDPVFVHAVEAGLRHLADCISLGRSSLPAQLGIRGETHIELGKTVQQRLLRAIDALRPLNGFGKNPPPRDCYNYMVLYEAYWEGIPNREIMAKLQISEGTFHRVRRAAVRAVARSLLESRASEADEQGGRLARKSIRQGCQ